MDRIRRELGMRVEIIDGQEEGRYGFAGAVRGTAGGERPALRSRRRQHAGVAFQQPAPGSRHQPAAGRASAERNVPDERSAASEANPPAAEARVEALSKAQGAALGRREQLLGTGGTLRNLAKIDRNARHYPITRLHGTCSR
jgi:exopolyphosphatase/pppGpp-phosphohydrolase